MTDTILASPPAAETHRKLYKIDSAGKLRCWYMEIEGHKHRVVAGIEGGSLVVNGWTECKAKGVGKARTTPEEQAAKEVAALYKKALDRDYYETPEEAAGPARNYLPMLAEGWKDTTWDKWLARIAAAGRTPYVGHTGAYFQPKLDGFCCIATKDGLQSREGLPILTAQHVRDALAAFFAESPDAVLHGELYNHALKDEFERLGSLLKKQKDITEEHRAEVAAKVQFHIYDYPEDGRTGDRDWGFFNRTCDLENHLWRHIKASGDVLHLVPTTPVRDEAHLLELTHRAIADGYEGGIGRLDLPYEKAKRSWSVIKIKFRMDAEFEVEEVIEGKGNYAGYAKAAMMRMPDGRRFKASIKGKRDQYLADLLTAGHKVATVEFFSYTHAGSGVPRQGVVTKWHGEARVL